MAATTLDILKKVAPHGKTVLLQGFSDAFDKYKDQFDVNTPQRINYFIAQAAEETNGFNSFLEYDSGAAYEGRADLGNTSPGDGKKFRGRGIFMTTGKGNYKTVSQEIFKDNRLLTNPELLEQPEYATLAALWYWKDRSLNKFADKDPSWTFTSPKSGKTYNKMEYITLLINGGQNGLSTRELYYQRAIDALKEFGTYIASNPGTVAIFLLIIAAVLLLTNKSLLA